ncbi:MAG: HDIG domain-containing protein [bacterium]|nr:HDIG domain-containing protein [Candidatus Neomarinimicrobiota bacterium]MDD3966351.1 HDIG domain-containing protein [Candidatus Neomarinimicrobiota bacterium]MDX9780402.1 HDIG domain-containing protein [bacterium]
MIAKKRKSMFRDTLKIPFWTISVLIIMVLFSALMAPKKQSYRYNYQMGEITRTDIIAPYDFDILKPEELIRREQAEALKKVAYVFTLDESVRAEQAERTELFFQMAKTLEQRYHKYQQSLQTRNLERYSAPDLNKLNETVRTDSNAFVAISNAFREQYNINVAESPFTELYRPNDGNPVNLEKVRESFITHLYSLYESGISDIPMDSIRSTQIAVRIQGVEKPGMQKNIYDIASANAQLTENLAKDFEAHSQKILIARIAGILIKPNLVYDKERTVTRQTDMINRIPLVAGKVFKDEKIVGANTLITEEIFQKIYSLNVTEEKRNASMEGWNAVLKVLGDILVMIVIYMIFVIFLILYDKSIFNDVNRFLLLIICMLLSLGLGSVIAMLAPANIALVPMTITAMLLMVFFDERIAMTGSAVVLLVLTYVMGGSFRFIILHVFPVMMAIISLRGNRNRENVLRPLLFVLIGYVVGIAATGISSLESPSQLMNMSAMALGNAVVSVLVTNGLMIMLEKIFGVTTSLSLLELSDMNRPLLKRLSLEAPGTFNHCIVVGNLLETAADKIGANSLLARVGAYYHDIGKLSKAEYFVENQASGNNKLDQLKPHMAAKVIISHVRNGMDLAEEEKLPNRVKDFIAMHHGTMLVDYFYQKAKEESGENAVQENEFRYPGPKPNSKETGLLMIVEAAEAAVRSLVKPSPRNIEAKIDDVIEKRLYGGQLDECPLTIADVQNIKKAIYPMLVGLYHERLPYPEDKKDEEKSGDKKEEHKDEKKEDKSESRTNLQEVKA